MEVVVPNPRSNIGYLKALSPVHVIILLIYIKTAIPRLGGVILSYATRISPTGGPTGTTTKVLLPLLFNGTLGSGSGKAWGTGEKLLGSCYR